MFDEDLVERIINKAMNLGASFVEVRGEDKDITQIEMQDRTVKSVISGHIKGMSIRVLYNGAWGFSAVNLYDKEKIEHALMEALKAAKRASEKVREPIRIIELRSVKDVVRADVIADPRDIDPSEKAADVKRLHDIAFDLGKDVLKTIRTDYMLSLIHI